MSDDETIDVEYEREREATRAEAAAVLHDIADGVAEGSVSFGDGTVTAPVPDRFELEVEYARETDAGEIEVELEWPLDESDGNEEDDEDESEPADDDAEDEDGEAEAGDEEEDEDEGSEGVHDDGEATASRVGDQRVGAAEHSGTATDESDETDGEDPDE